MTQAGSTVRDFVSRKQNTARGNVIAMPAAQAVEDKHKNLPTSLNVTMPSLITTAGFRFLRSGGNIDRFREQGGTKLTRRQATDLLLLCLCEELFGTPRRAA